jgi:FHS family L-fucose permease-like MFS transporter
MGIVGGAIFPPIMGRISDLTNIQTSYLVPVICFVYIGYFAIINLKVKKVEMVASH